MDLPPLSGSENRSATQSSVASTPKAVAGKNSTGGGSGAGGPAPASAGVFSPDVGGAGVKASGLASVAGGLFSGSGSPTLPGDLKVAAKAWASSIGVGMKGVAGTGGVLGSKGGKGSSNHVGIVKMDLGLLGTGHFCCGAVGVTSGLKMCTVTKGQCNVDKHKSAKHDVSHLPSTGSVWFISGLKSSGTNVVQLEPHLVEDDLTIEAIKTLTNIYRPLTRAQEDWMKIFDTIKSLGINDDSLLVRGRLDDIEEVIVHSKQEPFTPLKHSRLVEAVQSPSLEGEYDVPFMQLSMSYSSVEDVTGDAIKRDWRTLISNFSVLRDLAESSIKSTRSLKATVSAGFKDVDLIRSDIQKDVGTRPAEWGTASLFAAVDSMAKKQDCIADILQHINGAISTKDQQGKMIYGGIVTQGFKQAQDYIGLHHGHLNQVTTSLVSANEKIAQMEKEIQALKLAGSGQPIGNASLGSGGIGSNPFGSLGHVPFGTAAQSVSNQGTAAVDQVQINSDNQAAMAALESHQLSLERRIGSMESTWAMSGQCLEFGSVRFDNPEDAEAFIQKNAIAEKDLCFFPDLHALLAIASQGGVTSSKDSFNLRASAAKSGFKSVDAGLVMCSFDYELPTIFGETPASGDTFIKNREYLPAAKSIHDWDNTSGRKGTRYLLAAATTHTEQALRKGAAANLAPEALDVAIQCISEASNASRVLSSWISQTTIDLTAKGMKPARAWALISMQVREFFTEVHLERQVGKGPYSSPELKTSTVLWGCMKGMLKVREFAKLNFGGHAVMGHILNVFLRDNVIMKEDLTDLEKKVEAIDKVAKGAKSAADRAAGRG